VSFFAVFDILLRYTTTGSWKDAFFGAIPKRKQLQRNSTDADDKHLSDCTELAEPFPADDWHTTCIQWRISTYTVGRLGSCLRRRNLWNFIFRQHL